MVGFHRLDSSDEKLGFKAESEEFLEDGIPHVRMRLVLQKL